MLVQPIGRELTVKSTVSLRCPACKTVSVELTDAGARCTECGFVGSYNSNVLDLRLNSATDSALDLDSYDAHHNVNEASARGLIIFYQKLIDTYMCVQPNRVLEIGAGTGHLTSGLCSTSSFTEVHCSDISPRFMARLHAKLSRHGNGRLQSYLFDANDFPFANDMFSAVLGHSVLHHLAHFEKAIENAYRVLQPGGVAIFGEPMMETHALLSLAAGQILAVDGLSPDSKLSARSKMVLTVISQRGGRATRFLLERPTEVHVHEDKFIFLAEYMRQQANRLGFSRFQVEQWGPVCGLGKLIQDDLEKELDMNAASGQEVAPYRPLLQAFSDSYEPALQPFVSQLFAFPVFIK